jgi:glycerophosphoryl diester phosphodiesterase
MVTRREFVSMVAAFSLAGRRAALAKTNLRLIAHRGGIVDDIHVENSPGSLEAAIAAGFWMAEVDVRRTRDGRAILQHDSNFKRYFGNPAKVSDLDWAEIKELRAVPGGSRPMEFDELAALCKGRIRLMLDVKEEPHPAEFYAILRSALERNGLLGSTYILSGEDTEKVFRGLGPLAAADEEALRAAAGRGDDLAQNYYLFEDADAITEETVALARKHNVDAVAAVNTFRYRGADAMEKAQADLRRTLQLGVTTFQIDSVYQPYLVGL